ncbi:MAG: SCE4755 family polysaccharide monooxygenase-like protein [Gemmatimonadota bacterium]
MPHILRLTALTVAGLAILTFGTADSAEAHVCLMYPMSRVGPDCAARSPQKIGPCGVAGRSEQVTQFRPGETITVELNETINHPSHYRVSFNPDGDTFHDPVSIDDNTGAHPFVLVDGIEDAEDARQEVQVTLPLVECENCTLQLIQVMYDKQGNGFGGANGGPDDNDDLYYACADLVLRGEPVTADAPLSAPELERTASSEDGRGLPLPLWPALALGALFFLGRPARGR